MRSSIIISAILLIATAYKIAGKQMKGDAVFVVIIFFTFFFLWDVLDEARRK